jgi:hypothetical protein
MPPDAPVMNAVAIDFFNQIKPIIARIANKKMQ